MLLTLGLIGLAILAYFNSVSNPFLYDDVDLVIKNPEIRSLSNIPEFIGFTEDGFKPRTRWTRDVTYALEYNAVGNWSPLFHIDNIVLHALVGLLFFLLITRVSRDQILGWWAAALFVVHPINTEVVAHISGRRGLLAALFSLIALVLLERYSRIGGVWRIVVAAVALYLGAFSKEWAVMAPLAFVLLGLYARFHDPATAGPEGVSSKPGLFRELRTLIAERRQLLWILGLLMVGLTAGILFMTADMSGLQGSQSYYEFVGRDLGALDRARLTGLGLRLVLFPVGQSVDYSYDALGIASGGWRWLAALDVALVLAALGLTGYGLLRRKWIGFAGLWFLIFYLPHIGIIRWHEIFAERFLYFAMPGICVAAAALLVRFARVPRWSRVATVVGLLVVGLLTFATIQRNADWSSPLTLWKSAVDRYPESARANKALGDAYMEEMLADRALDHYRKAASILPEFRDARIGVAYALTAKLKVRDAMDALDEILDIWPDDPKALNLLGYLHQTMGDQDAAMASYQQAVESDPRFAEGYNNLGRLYVEQGDVETAIEMYEKAREYDPTFVTPLLNLATVYRHAYEDEERALALEEEAKKLGHLR